MAGEDALEIYNTFTRAEEGDDKKTDKIMDKLAAYCNPRKNINRERHVFSTRNQQSDEPIDQYVTDLRIKAKSCEFSTLTDTLIKDCIVCGTNDGRTCSRLLKESDLTLHKALDICCTNEATATHMKSLSSTPNNEVTPTTNLDINIVRKDDKVHSNKYQYPPCG